MITKVSDFSQKFYTKAARPLLFKFPADSVHAAITNAGIAAQVVPGVLPLMKACIRYEDKQLHQNLHGIKFENPIGLSAGFDKEVRLPKLMHSIGFGLCEVGSITAKPYGGNLQPWYSRLPHTKSILVNSGLRSSGVEVVAGRTDKLPSSVYNSIPINASVAKTNIDSVNTVELGIKDYCASLKRLEKSPWPKLYTINISCPNTAGGEPFNLPSNLKKLLDAIDGLKLSRPVFLKQPIDLSWQDSKKLLDVAAKSTLAGITIGNLSKDRSAVDKRDSLKPSQRGNLSGRPCWRPSNDLLARAYAEYGKRFTFIGVGGVFSAEDAYTKIRLGASMVEMITGMIYQGPALIGDINSKLVKFLARDGFKSIPEAVGVDAKSYVKERR